MPITAKPTVTDDHLKKYEAIMGTAIKSNVPPSPTPTQIDKSSSSISLLLASLSKIKGIGNKMFIFTGKKKIIMDGTKKVVEDIKTVDIIPLQEKEEKKAEEKPQKILSEQELIAKNVQLEVVESKVEEKKTPELKKISNIKSQVSNISAKSKLTTILLAAITILFIAAWTLFWLNFFSYIKLF